MRFLPEEEQRRLIAACFARSDLTLEQLWMRYFALGGSLGLLELDAYLNGLTALPRVDRDMLAHAVNERLDEVAGPARAPYSHSVRDAKPLHGPLKALVDLLEGAHRAPPERLPAIVAEAGRALDLTIGVYLADYDQRTLVPLRPGAAELDIETTVGGDVFRHAGTTVARDGTLWTVLLDGVERLGVLEIVPGDDADPEDPVLREQCRWLAALLGHLVTITTQYGDGLDSRRRRRHRGSPAELLWQSLPPLTGATESIVVGASIQPAYELCGTVFDYALSEQRAQLALFEAGPRSGSANIAVVNALSAYRAARHDGAPLGDQFAAVGAELAAVPGIPAVTGVVAELDLDSGTLRWLNAGSPGPLLVRGGEVLPATAPARPRFAAGEPPPTAEVRLEPGDLLALHSRGAAETRDRADEPFGGDRIARHLGDDAGELPPEIARRLTRAVLAHSGGEPRQDAAVLVARWLS
ncbi:PP2C family protein-serine/threonine phosphatase [Amycolatopsis sp. NPDC021455]|uniref:PP2C family protein-serine/threonine phosphatase n=1 Tax=Amycolatopsis sp. NPDC021455 TaxID=3154901 RepID=UPI0033EDF697